MSDWKSMPIEEEHKEFLRELSSILIENIFEGVQKNEPVLKWREPDHLSEIICLEPGEEPKSQTVVLNLIKNVYKFSVKTGHPYFMNQLFSGLDPYGLAAQWLTDALNASVYTYEVAPVLTLLEQTLIKRVLKMFYKYEHSEVIGDGLFCPGGSYANGSAINLARFSLNPEIKSFGISGLKLVLFTSEDAHYSVLKWANMCGLGEKNVISVATDELGRMIPTELEMSILREQAKGNTGFMVSATAGTTVLGAFDPLDKIADLCAKHKMWLHVDAAWGGGLIFSKKHRGLLASIERADSIAFNPHKLLAVPQQCSLLLTKHAAILEAAHSRKASYLFQKDKFYPSHLDVGDKYMQCGRRGDVLKFWIMWQAKGTSGFDKHVDHLMSVSEYLRNEIERRIEFQLVAGSEFINVCFWYIPPSLRNRTKMYDFNERLHKLPGIACDLLAVSKLQNKEYKFGTASDVTLVRSEIHKSMMSYDSWNDFRPRKITVAPKLKELMTKKGSLMIGYQPWRDKPNFFRFVVQNSGVTVEDMNYVLDELDRLGRNL